MIAKLIGTYPHTLIHGDTHAGNDGGLKNPVVDQRMM
jgi:hypothetical protein